MVAENLDQLIITLNDKIGRGEYTRVHQPYTSELGWGGHFDLAARATRSELSSVAADGNRYKLNTDLVSDISEFAILEAAIRKAARG